MRPSPVATKRALSESTETSGPWAAPIEVAERLRRGETLQDDVSPTWKISRLRARAEGFPVALCTPSGTPSDEVDLK